MVNELRFPCALQNKDNNRKKNENLKNMLKIFDKNRFFFLIPYLFPAFCIDNYSNRTIINKADFHVGSKLACLYNFAQ